MSLFLSLARAREREITPLSLSGDRIPREGTINNRTRDRIRRRYCAPVPYLIDERQQRQRQRGRHERCTEYAAPRSSSSRLHHNSIHRGTTSRTPLQRVLQRVLQQQLTCVRHAGRRSSQPSTRHSPRALVQVRRNPCLPHPCASRGAKRLPSARRADA